MKYTSEQIEELLRVICTIGHGPAMAQHQAHLEGYLEGYRAGKQGRDRQAESLDGIVWTIKPAEEGKP